LLGARDSAWRPGTGDVNKLLNPAYWGRALTHPVVLLGLVVDLLPVLGVIVWGWGATPLVMLYWMENIVAGVMTIPRIVISGATFGSIGLLAGAALSAFFVFHYGLFCLVHGTFLVVFASFFGSPELANSAPVMDLFGIIRFGMESGLHVDWMLYAIIGMQVIVLVNEFVLKGEWKTSNPMAEMFAPYSRILVLHFAIFGGAAGLFLLGQPMIGVLGLIVFRAVYGVLTNARRAGIAPEGEFDKAIEKLGGRENFAKLLRGEKID
jgi:hypothetical protein